MNIGIAKGIGDLSNGIIVLAQKPFCLRDLEVVVILHGAFSRITAKNGIQLRFAHEKPIVETVQRKIGVNAVFQIIDDHFRRGILGQQPRFGIGTESVALIGTASDELDEKLGEMASHQLTCPKLPGLLPKYIPSRNELFINRYASSGRPAWK